jgi:hypothetical protein
MFDASPMLFGLVPFSLIYPLFGFTFTAYLIFAISNSWIAGAVVFLTCTTSYAILTSKGSHKYLSRLLQAPPRWIRLPLPFRSYLEYLHDLDNIKKNPKTKAAKRRL